jgi:hypothetical protein
LLILVNQLPAAASRHLGIGRNIAYFALGYGNNFTNGQSLSIDLFSPQTAKTTHYGPGVFWNGEVTNAGFIAGIHKSTSIFDGFYNLSPSLQLFREVIKFMDIQIVRTL